MRWTSIGLGLVLLFSQPVRAAPPLAGEDWTPSARLQLARAVVGEADWNAEDHVAIAWVLSKRFKHYKQRHEQVSFERYIGLYAKALTPRPERRTLRILSYPWAPLLERSREAERWDEVRDRIESWGRGEIGDPCPRALHWGGRMDRPQAHWRPVVCGRTANIFWTPRW